MTSRKEGQSRNTMSDSSHSSCDDTISYLEDSDIGECYADPERQRLCLWLCACRE